MARSETPRRRSVAVLATFALSPVVITAAIIVYGPPSTGNIPVDESAAKPLKLESTPHSSHANDRHAVEPRILRSHSRVVGVVATSTDGARLLSADTSDLIRTWDRYEGVPLTKIAAAEIGLRRAIVSSDSQYILACGKDTAIRMWKTNSGEAVREFRGHVDAVSALRCVPGTDQFISSSFDGSLILWDVQTGELIRQFGTASNAKDVAPQRLEDLEKLDGHFTWIRDLVVLPDGERVISAGNDAVLFFWDVGTGILVDRLVGHKTVIMGLTLSPDGHFVVSLGADQEIIVWDVELRKLLRRAAYSGNGFPAAAISPDSRLLALGDDTGIIRIVDLESGEECSQIETGGIGVTSLAFTPELEGTEIIAGCADGAIRIWPADMER